MRKYCRMALTQMSMPKPMMSHHSHWLSVLLFIARLCWMPTPPPPPWWESAIRSTADLLCRIVEEVNSNVQGDAQEI